jgi:exodeoxyribonuclease VII small subunit
MSRRASTTPDESTSASRAAPAPEGATFEVAIKRLNEIVGALERGDLALEESLKLFEEGVQLARASQQRLDAAEKRVEMLLSVDDEGRPSTTSFSTTAEAEPDEDVPF